MTNHWIDIGNSDCIMIIGSNAAENHPISFKWVTKAMKNGAKLISVDPRFTRTSSKADIYAKMRSGTDIAIIGGMVNYVVQNRLYNEDYVKAYTNALFLLKDNFETPYDRGDGLFSGFTQTGGSGSRKIGMYDNDSWKYLLDNDGYYIEAERSPGVRLTLVEAAAGIRDYRYPDNPTVFEKFAAHYSRYDANTVCSITGTNPDVFREICETYCATGEPGKAGTIMYAMGSTQHTYGTQNVRSYAILQLLLGNMGVAGGGINALRGESNVQGSTDHCLLFHILPGYLKVPKEADVDLATYVANYTPAKFGPDELNWWGVWNGVSNTERYIVSLLKDYFGSAATAANDFGYGWLPKLPSDQKCDHIGIFDNMNNGIVKGVFCMGQNPAVGGPNSSFERGALRKLDWLVAADLWETETAAFWQFDENGNPLTEREMAQIPTEVFLLPAAASFEKEGSITNSGRWIQWRYKAKEPPGNARHDLGIVWELGDKIKSLYAGTGDVPDKLNWYATEPTADQVAMDVNGWYVSGPKAGQLVEKFTTLAADGSTSSANWLYCGSFRDTAYPDSANNRAKDTDPTDEPNTMIGLYPNFSWAWPLNRRIIYNGASIRPFADGTVGNTPWDPTHPVLLWNGSSWIGDVNDAVAAPGSKRGVFIMKPEGHGRLHGFGRKDGPYPEHYEPWECPIVNQMSPQQINPAIILPENRTPGGAEFDIIATTYRVSEHWQAGQMTRNLPWLGELVPAVLVEISEDLATELGNRTPIQSGQKVKVISARGSCIGYAHVTNRFTTYTIGGQPYHHIGLWWHWGYKGLFTGDSGNMLTPSVGDANTRIPEYKAFAVRVETV